LKFYLSTEKPTDGAFSSTKINKLLENFTDKSEMRSVIAGKIKRAITDEGLDDMERSDAKFAYALIMGHYDKHHKKQSYAESLLKAAYDADNLGALYVWGRRIYLGEGVPKNVNRAANFIQSAHSTVEDLIQENDEMPGDRWEEPGKLWNLFATDLEYEDHKMWDSMREAAGNIRAELEKEKERNSGSQARKEIDKLERIRKNSEKMLQDAFDIAGDIAARTTELRDLKNQAKSESTVVKKTISISDETSKTTANLIKTIDKDLDPSGMKKVDLAHQNVRYVIAQTAQALASWMSSGLSGGLSDMFAASASMGKSLKLSCGLDNALVTYKKKKKLALPAGPLKSKKSDFGGM